MRAIVPAVAHGMFRAGVQVSDAYGTRWLWLTLSPVSAMHNTRTTESCARWKPGATTVARSRVARPWLSAVRIAYPEPPPSQLMDSGSPARQWVLICWSPCESMGNVVAVDGILNSASLAKVALTTLPAAGYTLNTGLTWPVLVAVTVTWLSNGPAGPRHKRNLALCLGLMKLATALSPTLTPMKGVDCSSLYVFPATVPYVDR